MTIEGAIQAYLQEQKERGRDRKTLQWHQTALGLWQQYLVDECHLGFLGQITSEEVRGWLAFLRTPSSTTGRLRGASTIATYGRSVRAFCHWIVRKGYLDRTPVTRGLLPKAEKKRMHLLEPSAFDRLLLACRVGGDVSSSADQAAARNRAILWVLLDTGMRVSELCGLRLADVDQEQRALRVQRREGKEHWMTLSAKGWDEVLSYLEQSRPKRKGGKEEGSEEDHLFLSEWYQPLLPNSITLLCNRLKKRAGLTENPMNPSVLRDTFAVRYLQAGGEPEALREILGLAPVTSVTCYQRLIDGQREKQKEPAAEEQPERRKLGPHTRRQRRRRSSSMTTKGPQKRAQGGASGSHGSTENTLTRAGDDP